MGSALRGFHTALQGQFLFHDSIRLDSWWIPQTHGLPFLLHSLYCSHTGFSLILRPPSWFLPLQFAFMVFFCQDHLQMADFLTHVPVEMPSLLLPKKQHPSSPSSLSIPPHPTFFLHGAITNYYLINCFLIFVSSMRISSSRQVGLCPGPSEKDKEWYIIVKQFNFCFLLFYILFCPRWKLGPSHDFSLCS